MTMSDNKSVLDLMRQQQTIIDEAIQELYAAGLRAELQYRSALHRRLIVRDQEGRAWLSTTYRVDMCHRVADEIHRVMEIYQRTQAAEPIAVNH